MICTMMQYSYYSADEAPSSNTNPRSVTKSLITKNEKCIYL